MSYRLTGGAVVRTLSGPIDAEDLSVEGDRIVADAPSATTMDVSGCLVIPGNACAHHHLYSYLARGMPAPPVTRTFVDILREIWWKLDRALDDETVRLSALAGAIDAARRGTTSIIDHHSSPTAIDSSLDAVAEALDDAGVRGIVCYEVSDRHGETQGRRGIAENVRFLKTNGRALIRGMMGAHASFTLGQDTLETLVSEARGLDVPIHVHLAEDEVDERDSIERYGVRATVRLRRMGVLSDGDLAAHGVRLDADERAILRESGSWLAHNPRSNMNNAVGYAPVADMGERVALGTDGIDGDMFEEVRACFLKAREKGTSVAPLQRLARGPRIVAARFGEPLLGELVPGAPADLVVLDYASPTPLETSNLESHFLFGMGSWNVRDVMVAGRWVVRDRRHELIDEEEVAANCRVAAPKVWERMRLL